MHIIIVTNYKKKFVVLLSVLCLWVAMFLVASQLINNSFILRLTINDKLTFSYPVSYEIDNVYINESASEMDIVANWQFKKPQFHKFSDFKSKEGKFGFSYPGTYELNQQHFEGSEILYHIDFRDKSDAAHGFVQVWNMSSDLKDFLETSKSNSWTNFKTFTMQDIKVNGNPGYLWNYSVYAKDGSVYRGLEAFFKKDRLMYRISYFVPEEQWSEANFTIFQNIVKSFKTF